MIAEKLEETPKERLPKAVLDFVSAQKSAIDDSKNPEECELIFKAISSAASVLVKADIIVNNLAAQQVILEAAQIACSALDKNKIYFQEAAPRFSYFSGILPTGLYQEKLRKCVIESVRNYAHKRSHSEQVPAINVSVLRFIKNFLGASKPKSRRDAFGEEGLKWLDDIARQVSLKTHENRQEIVALRALYTDLYTGQEPGDHPVVYQRIGMGLCFVFKEAALVSFPNPENLSQSLIETADDCLKRSDLGEEARQFIQDHLTPRAA